MSLSSCKFGGNSACVVQGGDGSLAHASSYTHPIPHISELSPSEGVRKSLPMDVQDDVPSVFVKDLDSFFDDDLSHALLSIDDVAVIKGGFHEIDLHSPEGIEAFLDVLSIMDPEIIGNVYKECFPGYSPERLSPRVARIELRAFFMDYLELTQSDKPTEEDNVPGDTEGTSSPDDEAPTAEEGDFSPND